MLKKLFKYDFKSILKVWLIGSVSTLGLSVITGFCVAGLNTEKEIPFFMETILGIALFTSLIGFSAFTILSTVLIFIRFYKNLFTDEGYLSFTLPVKRSTLLNSKILNSIAVRALTYSTLIISGIIVAFIGYFDYFTSEVFIKDLKTFMADVFADLGNFVFIYIVEAIILVILLVLISDLFIFFCTTIASVIVKKAKVPVAIGIYYGITSVFSFIASIGYLVCFSSVVNWISQTSDSAFYTYIALILLIIILLLALFCTVLYAIQFALIDKKLNLS